MAYVTVADYITAARTLLQDTVLPYRYNDAGLVEGLNGAFASMNRIRPDILVSLTYASRTPRFRLTAPTVFPVYSSSVQGITVICPIEYQPSVLFYVIGYAQTRDTEDVQDARASAFLAKFTADLLKLG